MPAPSGMSRGSGVSVAHPDRAVPVASSLPETDTVEVPYEWVWSLARFASHTRWRLPSAVRSAPNVAKASSVVPRLVHTPGPPAHAGPARVSIDSAATTPIIPIRNFPAHIPHLLQR